MKELSDIVAAADSLRKSGKKGALATVVKVQGSAYRRPGARMLFSEHGREAGFISAGCLETDLMERAKSVMSLNEPAIVSYDTSSTDDLIMGLGLGCNGLVELLVEPLQNGAALEKNEFFGECVRSHEKAVLATVFRAKNIPGVCVGDYLHVSQGKIRSSIHETALKSSLQADAEAALNSEKSLGKSYLVQQGEVEVFIEVILPPQPLVIFGAGLDAFPVIKFAHDLGWHTTLVDHRPAYATKENFPLADSVILSQPEDISQHLKIDGQTVAVIMTHNFPTDLKLLKVLLPSPALYVGLLGPKSKSELLMQHLKDDGFKPAKDNLAKLHSPVGIDIGAETPEEIAFSIVAEIKAVLQGRAAGFLKDHEGPIHTGSNGSLTRG
ncbi:MAG: XdhC family protein [Ignavibacteriales bacterium]|nr:XdhC family protein [Ignavibacteriales bacterium]